MVVIKHWEFSKAMQRNFQNVYFTTEQIKITELVAFIIFFITIIIFCFFYLNIFYFFMPDLPFIKFLNVFCLISSFFLPQTAARTRGAEPGSRPVFWLFLCFLLYINFFFFFFFYFFWNSVCSTIFLVKMTGDSRVAESAHSRPHLTLGSVFILPCFLFLSVPL